MCQNGSRIYQGSRCSNVRKNRPGSWKLSLESTPDGGSLHSGTRAEASPTSEMQTLMASLLVDDLGLHEASMTARRGSVQHGRRSVLAGTRSAGSSPRRPQLSAQVKGAVHNQALEESWSSLSFFDKKHKGRLTKTLDEYKPSILETQSVHPSETKTPPEASMVTAVLDDKADDADFIIPELPLGRLLVLNIKSTWGDRHYLGLNGIEVFSSTGEPAPISTICADPADINVLPEYSKDPRVVGNLLDGVNRTHDDMHLWLAPFTPGADHVITITFQHTISVAMIRIWNYNKSRIHSYRGARDVEVRLDGVLVFRGEISRACGGILGGTQAFGDTILFTTDETILEMISHFDDSFSGLMNEEKLSMTAVMEDRPITAHSNDERPFTCARNASLNGSPASDTCDIFVSGQKIQFTLLANWGHPSLIGLTGLELVGDAGCAVPIEPHYLHCSERSSDIYRLVDGENVTTDERHMWCTHFSGGDVVLTIAFPLPVFVSSLRLWNYNASPELSYCGAKLVSVQIDGRQVWEGPSVFTARRAPGNCHFNFVQDVSLARGVGVDKPPAALPSPPVELLVDEEGYEPPDMPRGFVFQLLILSTWGDSYYVGLNGLEMFDDDGDRIALSESNIGAFPDSVNILEGVNNDVRTPEKLIDGVNETFDGRHMWLAPILPNQLNRVYIVFDYPVTVSMIKLWNYSKTPTRGVKEFEILVDDLLVYNGVLDKVSRPFGEPGNKVSYRTVLFTRDINLLRQERNTQVRHSSYGHAVRLLNNQQRVTSGGLSASADQSLRPLTSLVPPNRSKSMHDM
ncbi:katanin-interacting protein-like isoform X2 [Bacillus rossius redtenbacheri]|uniref:katanin-interacting protein-like isoform X2 n=1 Tax=Bacillus rossius redtenbacheri TaxID=93214 RepID=UPI002FDC8DFE